MMRINSVALISNALAIQQILESKGSCLPHLNNEIERIEGPNFSARTSWDRLSVLRFLFEHFSK
ncbi:MAG: hypothetical protein Rpha_2043 [Candidatus Ruthia sp. Apha_13_S6]|nr:hypothetical protein [Candidatus Ruthia sp. Apha_13_S6]